MPRPMAAETLPDALRAELDRRLAARAFSGYEDLAQWLREQGFEISKSALHRYGSRLKRKLALIRASTIAAQQIAEAAPDQEDARSAAVISLVQSELFEALLALQEASEADDPAERLKLLAAAARAIAEVARASRGQKEYAERVREKLAALEAEAEKKGRRLDPETLRFVREQLYGG